MHLLSSVDFPSVHVCVPQKDFTFKYIKRFDSKDLVYFEKYCNDR